LSFHGGAVMGKPKSKKNTGLQPSLIGGIAGHKTIRTKTGLVTSASGGRKGRQKNCALREFLGVGGGHWNRGGESLGGLGGGKERPTIVTKF